MAADLNINEITGTASVMTNGASWHGQGTIVTEAQTSEEAIKLAQLDWQVIKQPLFTQGNLGGVKTNFTEVPNHYATVRQDTGQPLGVVGSRYTILQNKECFKFIDYIVGSKMAVIETCGALGNGERVWLTCKLPEQLIVGKEDVADNYFFLYHSFDGSKPVELMFTNVFVVCSNTVAQAIRTGKRKQRVRHTASVVQGLHNAAELMGVTRQQIQEQKEMFEAMQKVQINDLQLRKFIELALKPEKEQINSEDFSTRFKNQVESVLEYALGDSAQLINDRRGNLWGAYNSITGAVNNTEKYKSGEKKLSSIMWGTGFDKSQKSLDLALDVLNNSNILS